MRPMADLPEDAIKISEAAKIAERSNSTIRRWIAQGRLARHEGKDPGTGSPAPVYVSQRELMAWLVTSGQAPRTADPPPTGTPPEAPEALQQTPADTRRGPPSAPAAAVEVERLKGELALAREQGRTQALEAELAGAKELQRAAEARASELRLLLAEERERVKGLEAELRALRAAQGLPWWRRLIGARPAIEAPPEGEGGGE